MKIKIWVLSTTIPEDTEPCWPTVFGSEEAARAGFKERMAEEWETQAPEDDEANPLPMPDDPCEAHEAIAKWAGPDWGTYKLTSHEVEIALPAPTGGLWTVGPADRSGLYYRHIYGPGGRLVGKAARALGRTEAENEANARLMAAAPALKAALAEMYEFASDLVEHFGMNQDDSMSDEEHSRWQDVGPNAANALNGV